MPRTLGSRQERVLVFRILRQHLRAATDLLWPPLCDACTARTARPAELFCETCWASLRAIRPGGEELTPGAPRVVAAFSVDPLFIRMLSASKYRGFRGAGRRLADEAAARVAADLPGGTLVPVPLTRARRRERGFNQPEDFAARLSDLAGNPVRPWLRRIRGGRPLAGMPRDERPAAVAGIYRASPDFPGPAAGPLLLVDDVVTSGSTAASAAGALRKAGGKVSAVVAMGRAFATVADSRPPEGFPLERL